VKQVRDPQAVSGEQQYKAEEEQQINGEERAATVQGRGRGKPTDWHRRHVVHRKDQRTLVDHRRPSSSHLK
jgi:hypothetical protein